MWNHSTACGLLSRGGIFRDGALLLTFCNVDRKGKNVMGNISLWFNWFLILLVLSVIAFVEGMYIGGSLGREWLIATHTAMVTLAVVLMQKYGIIGRTEANL
jgi:hypothetical protein